MKLSDILGFEKKEFYNFNKIYIYGLGTTGKLFGDICKSYKIPVNAYICGGVHNQQEKYCETSIIEISDNFALEDNDIIFYTVKQDIDLVLKGVNDNIKNKVIDISSIAIYLKLLELFYTEYFSNKNVKLFEKDIVDLNGLKIIGYKNIPHNYYLDFLHEAGDLILPECYDDFSRIDEGSYQISNVEVQKNDVVIDCGANLGLFSAVAANRGAKVYSFEPIEQNRNLLNKQANLYSQNIIVEPYALGEYCGICAMDIDECNLTQATVQRENKKITGKSFEMLTLDEFVEKQNLESVDFIKADIEGSERYLLAGAVKTIKKFLPKIAICTYHLVDDKEVLEKIIKNIDDRYIVVHKWKKLYAYVPK